MFCGLTALHWIIMPCWSKSFSICSKVNPCKNPWPNEPGNAGKFKDLILSSALPGVKEILVALRRLINDCKSIKVLICWVWINPVKSFVLFDPFGSTSS